MADRARGDARVDGSDPDDERPRLTALLRRVPDLISRLVRDEIASAKAEVSARVRAAATGVGLLVAAGVVALYGVGWLLGGAVDGLARVVPHWAAALIVGAVLTIVAGILVAIGLTRLRRGAPPIPKDTLASVREDIGVVSGSNR